MTLVVKSGVKPQYNQPTNHFLKDYYENSIPFC